MEGGNKMWLIGFYVIGCVVSAILGLCLLVIEEKNIKKGESSLQYEMISAMAILSWITIAIYAWNWIKKKKRD